MYFPMITEMKGKKILIAGGGKVALHKAKILLPFEPDIKIISPEFVPEFSEEPFSFDLNSSGEELIFKNISNSDSISATENTVPYVNDSVHRSVFCYEKNVAQIGCNESDRKNISAKNGMQKVSFARRKILDKDIISYDIVIAATGDKETDSHISEIAQKNNIPVNVVDVPELCTFIFPAMINDGPLHISVSTSGKSPIAAAKIRDEIKNNIPDFMPELVERLGEIRETVISENLSHDEKKIIFNKLYEYGLKHDGNIPENIVKDNMT